MARRVTLHRSHTRAIVRSGAAIFLLAALALALASSRAAAQSNEWRIGRFHVDVLVARDASLRITELIEVEFFAPRHGIFREIPVRYEFDERRYRVYEVSQVSVTDGQGRAGPVARETSGANVRLRIGDPERTVTGPQTYVIAYTLRGALNAFSDQDELFWNVSGAEWEVRRERVSATVRIPGSSVERAACFEGPRGSRRLCQQRQAPEGVTYLASGPLAPGDDLTIVAAFPKGAVAEPPLLLEDRPRSLERFFEATPVTVGAAGLILAGGLGLVGRNWWARGRDRRYLRRAATVEDESEGAAPLFDAPTVVVEYEPPEGIHPAQLGLLLDESADTKDLTATIVDLAVRGHLRIEEIPKQWLFSSADWRLERLEDGRGGLEPYESLLVKGIFGKKDKVKLSEVKGKVADDLEKAQKALYKDALERRWFTGDPQHTRHTWAALGCGLAIAGVVGVFALGATLGFGLVGLAVALLGVVLLATHRAMAARTAAGSELLRRTLGFRRYMETAEKHRAEFAEREGIFSDYLPYAIVFGCVDRWAKAFEGLDRDTVAATTSAWYVGDAPFSASAFSSHLESFSSHVSSTIAHTPGGSGGSGFSGGGAGGGGGGGGGGSW